MQSSPKVRIGYWNTHNSRRAINILGDRKCHSMGFVEVYRRIPMLERMNAYRTFYGEGASDQRRGAKDNPILTLKSLPSMGTMAVQASEEVPSSSRVAPQRWLHVSAFQSPVGPLAHINFHPNASVKNLPDHNVRVREYHESVVTFMNVWRFWRNEGFHCVLTADGNFPRGAESPGWMDIHEALDKLDASKWVKGIDLMGWSTGLTIEQRDVIPEKRGNSDHPGMVATFSRRGA